jgi:hypothetical protein
MKKTVLLATLFVALLHNAKAQSTILRAFPITDYIVDLSDSTKIVQVYLPEGPVIKDKQIGLLRAVYKTSLADTITIGYGRCNLIKGDYYYFSIHIYSAMRAPIATDILYIMVPKTEAFDGQCIAVAAHLIELDNVYDVPFFDRSGIFNNWTETNENATLDSMVKDIKFTGDYFLKSDAALNQEVTKGAYKGKKVLDVMISTTVAELKQFLDYIIIRPRSYAGHKWKISEIYATWITEGAPTRL